MWNGSIISNYTGTVDIKTAWLYNENFLPCYILCLAFWVKDLLKTDAEFWSSIVLFFRPTESKVMIGQTP